MAGKNGGGAPKGSRNRAQGKQFQEAIRKAAWKYSDDETKRGNALLTIATKLVGQAVNPDSPHYEFAVKEIGLRLDGKPTDTKEIGLSDGTAAEILGLSNTLRLLKDITAQGATLSHEAAVSDGLVLSAEIHTKEG
mgnify:FL=1|jgi:hypothetical protein|tara:strand:- start:1081 stop:1488 length:408 start_codon:yes stop_codon:yes gene_type:complete